MAKQTQTQQTKQKVIDFTEPAIIEPIIRVDGQKNIYETICEGPEEDQPELQAVGYAKVADKASGWVHYVITFKGTKITKITVSEPDMRGIVDEAAKIDFVTVFSDQDL